MGLFWLAFEALLALAAALVLVWWTFRSRREHAPPADAPGDPDA